MTRTRYRVGENAFPHFLACTVVDWAPAFANRECTEILLESLRFLHAHNRLVLFGGVVLENHLHLIATAANLTKEIGDFKSY
ncbi:MAG: hypothetical protein KJZ87_07795 [Thermoguttaceae bacterium]|nr:hypothetical protein [Thermoguttaceae bacterium]